MYSLASAAQTSNWGNERKTAEFEQWAAKNPDLVKGNSKDTARREFMYMTDPALNGCLPSILAATKQVMEAEPPGTKKRFQHEFLKICTHARKVGLAAAKRNLGLG
jgi:hypothetical protein